MRVRDRARASRRALVTVVVVVVVALGAPARADVAPKLEAEVDTDIDVDAFRLSIDPPRLVLGDTAQATLHIAAHHPDGTPLDDAPPQLRTSTGLLSSLKRAGPGEWTATFTPPVESFPHVAIVVASIDVRDAAHQRHTAVGFVALPLWGKGQTTVKTKPNSDVTVFIGGESFGPVPSGPSGEARVPIVVPPGPEHAVARSLDDAGNETQKTIDLSVPPFNRVALVALDDVAAADGAGHARLLAFAVDKKGEPLFDARLSSTSSVGAIGDARGIAPGMFLFDYRPGKAKPGPATIEVALVEGGASRARTVVELLSGRPTRAELSCDKAALSADEPRAVQVELVLFDDAHNAVPPQAATVDVDFGRIDRVDQRGLVRSFTWVLPAELAAGGGALRERATLRARVGDDVVGERPLALLPGKPAQARFDPIGPVVADGSSAVDVRLRVSDRAGNPLVPTGARLSVDDGAGELLAATVDERTFRARFVAAPSDQQRLVRLRGVVGDVEAHSDVKLVPRPRATLLVGPGLLGAYSLARALGGANDLGAGPELSLLVRLPILDGAWHAGVSVEMIQSVSLARTGVDRRDFPLYLEGAWRPLVATDVALHLGAAGGFVLSDVILDDERRVEPALAAQLVGGAAYRLGPGFVEADVRAGYSLPLSSPSAGPPVFAGVVAGYRFAL